MEHESYVFGSERPLGQQRIHHSDSEEYRNDEQYIEKVKANKFNPLRSLLGVILIVSTFMLWMIVGILAGFQAGGGLIILIPLFMLYKYLWRNFVIQKGRKSMWK